LHDVFGAASQQLWYRLRMISIQVTAEGDPHALADLISSTERASEPAIPANPAQEFLREYITQQDAERPSHDEIDTVNFKRLDDDNDWTDV
jgi:hypothetical protein